MRVVLLVLTLTLVGASTEAQATETESESGEGIVTITVKETNWGTGSPENIKSLLENVAWHMTRHFRERLHATIEVENSPLGPKTLLRIPGQTTYTIMPANAFTPSLPSCIGRASR